MKCRHLQKVFYLTKLVLMVSLVDTFTVSTSFALMNEIVEEKIQVFGQVTSSQDETSLPGVTVLEKGTTNGTITDIDGNYRLGVEEGATIVVSFVGYLSQEIEVSNQSKINIALEVDVKQLDEVVVIGYGTAKKSDLTGSVATVDTKALQNTPNSRIDQALQGRAAGVQVTQTSGAPGAGTTIRIRGGNSIQGDNQPLWVIDGIIVGQDFNLNNLNSNDIQSIQILKDASSIAIYGSRGANGVVLVTTKSGAATKGKPQVNFGFYSGMQFVPGRPAYLSQADQIEYTNEDARFRSAAEPFSDSPSAYPDNDWFDLLINPAAILNGDVSVSGSSENGKVNYYNSLNYFNQDGLIDNSGIERYSFRSNMEVSLTDKLSTGFRLNYSRIHQDNGTVGYGQLLATLPTLPIYNEDGSFNGFNDVVGSPFSNPVANAVLNTNETYTNNLLGTIFLDFKPNKQWVIRSTFSPEFNNTKTNVFNSSRRPDYIVVGLDGDARVNALSSFGWNNENTVQYQTDIGLDHKFTALGGASFQRFTSERFFAEAYGITTDATGFHNLGLGSDPIRNVVGSDYDEFSIASFFGRINYAFKDKYLLTFVGRSDGSSRFAPGNKYEFYPSLAAAWKISEEAFMKNVNFVNDLKLRTSFGRSGSQGINSFRTLALMTSASTTYNGVLIPGVTLGRPSNPNLRWETTTGFDLALEAALFKNRVFAEFNYYHKQTNDLLLEVVVPRQTGFTSQLQNIGSLENKGWELLLQSTNISKRDFEWNSTLTLSSNKNKVLDLGGSEFIDVVVDQILGAGNTRIIVGEAAPVFTGVRNLGTWKSQEEIDASGMAGQVVGGPRFEDLNGDGIISTEDFVVLGSPQPDLVFGLENSMTYKDFEFSFFFQGTVGNEVYNLRTRNSLFSRGELPKYAETVNRWSPDNPNSDIPRAGGAAEGIPSNSADVEDGSHIRLKMVRLAYNLPVQKLGINSVNRMSVYFTGTNLFLASQFRLIDPESSRFGSTGVGNIAQGFSDGEYPMPRVLTLGVNVTF